MKEILATLAVIVLGAACADRETYTERLEGVPLLLGEFTSYAAEAHVRAQLGSTLVVTLERGGTRADDTRPPFDIVRLRVAYSHLGQTWSRSSSMIVFGSSISVRTMYVEADGDTDGTQDPHE